MNHVSTAKRRPNACGRHRCRFERLVGLLAVGLGLRGGDFSLECRPFLVVFFLAKRHARLALERATLVERQAHQARADGGVEHGVGRDAVVAFTNAGECDAGEGEHGEGEADVLTKVVGQVHGACVRVCARKGVGECEGTRTRARRRRKAARAR